MVTDERFQLGDWTSVHNDQHGFIYSNVVAILYNRIFDLCFSYLIAFHLETLNGT